MSKALISVNDYADTFSNHSDDFLVAVLSDDDFQRGHIIDSVQLSPTALSSGQKPAPGLLPPLVELEANLETIGLPSDQSKLISVYDNASGSIAGRFIWTLALLGYHNTRMINGGLKAWQAAGLSLTQDATVMTASNLSLSIDKRFLASKKDVLASLDETNSLIWDARGEDEYSGEKVLAARGGHIPGAISHDWILLHGENGTIKDLDQIQFELANKGLTSDKHIITHCQTHRRSGLTWFVANKLLGYENIQAYPGSWSEWGNDEALPIEP